MNVSSVLGIVVIAVLLAYLFYALLRPEKLQ